MRISALHQTLVPSVPHTEGWDHCPALAEGIPSCEGTTEQWHVGNRKMVSLLRSRGSVSKNRKIIFHQSTYPKNTERQLLGTWKGFSVASLTAGYMRKAIRSRCQEPLPSSCPEHHNSSGTSPKGISPKRISPTDEQVMLTNHCAICVSKMLETEMSEKLGVVK